MSRLSPETPLLLLALCLAALALPSCGNTPSRRSVTATPLVGSLTFHDPIGNSRGSFTRSGSRPSPQTLTLTSRPRETLLRDQAEEDNDIIVLTGTIDPRLARNNETGLRALRTATRQLGSDKSVPPERLGRIWADMVALGIENLPRGEEYRLPLGEPYFKLVRDGKATYYLRPTRSFEQQRPGQIQPVVDTWRQCVVYMNEVYTDAYRGPES